MMHLPHVVIPESLDDLSKGFVTLEDKSVSLQRDVTG